MPDDNGRSTLVVAPKGSVDDMVRSWTQQLIESNVYPQYLSYHLVKYCTLNRIGIIGTTIVYDNK
jgi:hypothetical protein